MSVSELKERHVAAIETVNSLKERLKQKRHSLLDTNGELLHYSGCFFFLLIDDYVVVSWFGSHSFCWLLSAVAAYARSLGRNPVCFGATDLVCCRTLQGHTGKVRFVGYLRGRPCFFLFYLCKVCLS